MFCTGVSSPWLGEKSLCGNVHWHDLVIVASEDLDKEGLRPHQQMGVEWGALTPSWRIVWEGWGRSVEWHPSDDTLRQYISPCCVSSRYDCDTKIPKGFSAPLQKSQRLGVFSQVLSQGGAMWLASMTWTTSMSNHRECLSRGQILGLSDWKNQNLRVRLREPRETSQIILGHTALMKF